MQTIELTLLDTVLRKFDKLDPATLHKPHVLVRNGQYAIEYSLKDGFYISGYPTIPRLSARKGCPGMTPSKFFQIFQES